MFVYLNSNVTYQFLEMLMVLPSGSSSVDGDCFHIPFLCVAASLPLPLKRWPWTNIFFSFLKFYNVTGDYDPISNLYLRRQTCYVCKSQDKRHTEKLDDVDGPSFGKLLRRRAGPISCCLVQQRRCLYFLGLAMGRTFFLFSSDCCCR